MLTIDRDQGILLLPGGPQWSDRAHQLGLTWHRGLKTWWAPLRSRFAIGCLQLLSPDEITRDALPVLTELAAQEAGARADLVELEQARTDDAALNRLAAGLTYVTAPYRHQVHALLHLLRFPRWGLFLEMGCGKTKVAVDAFRILQELGEVDRLLVVCPARLQHDAWARDLAVHGGLVAQVLEGTRASKVQQFQRSRSAVVVTNYEAITPDQLAEFVKVLAAGRWMIVFDEAARLGGKSMRHKVACELAAVADRVYCLTGTPFSGKLERLHGLYHVLDGGETFGPSFPRFLEVAQRLGAPVDWVGEVQWAKCPTFVASLRAGLARTSVTWELTACLDMPARVQRVVRVELGPEQRHLYDEARCQSWDNTLVGVSDPAIVRTLRLAQVTSGFYWDREAGEYRRTAANAKLDVLEDMLADELAEAKVIIWSRFLEEVVMVRELLQRLKIGHAELSGRIANPAKRDAELARFRGTPGCRVLVGTPMAGGEGLTINEATVQVFYSVGYDWSVFAQAMARNFRIGQHRPTVVFQLLAEDTVDEDIHKCLAKKQNLRDVVVA